MRDDGIVCRMMHRIKVRGVTWVLANETFDDGHHALRGRPSHPRTITKRVNFVHGVARIVDDLAVCLET